MQLARGHRVHNRPPSFLYPPTPYSCPNSDCIASTHLHFALRNQQQAAVQQGRTNLDYIPFHEIKAQFNDAEDEACHLAAFDDYPPPRTRSARVGPEWLKYKEWRKVLEMRTRGKNILEIATAVDKNASLLRVYVDTYLKGDISTHNVQPLPSASSTDSQSTADTSTGSDELFPLHDEVILPVTGAPLPSFLTRSEQELVWKMFQRNETVRSMCEQLNKNRRKISQYINAYMRPKLLKLQAEEREAEHRLAGTSTYVTPLTDLGPRTRMPEVSLTTAVPGRLPRLLREESLHSIGETNLDLELTRPLLFNGTPNVPDQSPKSSSMPNPLATPKSANDSLFGDSPVDGTETSSLTGISTRELEEIAQPTSKKRKLDDDDLVAEARWASKRLRHGSFP